VRRELLGRERAAIDTLLGVCPESAADCADGSVLLKFPKGSDISDIRIGANGRIACYGYTEDRGQDPRVTPAHFISVLVLGDDDQEGCGMVLDLSRRAIRVRLRGVVHWRPGDSVEIDFSYPEAGVSHRLKIKGYVQFEVGN